MREPRRAGRDCPTCGLERSLKANQLNCQFCRAAIVAVRDTAMYEVNRAVRRGELPRQRDCTCTDCGAQARAYDHRDYLRPMDVSPVCYRCNSRRPPARTVAAEPIEHIVLYCARTCLRKLAPKQPTRFLRQFWREALTKELQQTA